LGKKTGIKNKDTEEIIWSLFPIMTSEKRHRELQGDAGEDMFRAEDLIRAAKRLKTGKTPGLDGISNEVIRRVAAICPSKLLEMYNKCMAEGGCYPPWKIQRVVLIPKQAKEGAPAA